MLLLPIVLIVGTLVTSVPALPRDYDQPPLLHQNSPKYPSYQYKYTVGDSNGRGQGKVETRSGELASGRYYINGDQSSTEVKYFADEWGYHPFVKYRASNERSTANAHLALDNHEAQMLINNTEVEEVDASAEPAKNSTRQVIIPISQIENMNKESTSITESLPSNSEALEIPNIPELSQIGIDHQNQSETVSESTNINESAQYSETLADSISTSNQINALSAAASAALEEYLLNENAGGFGQRIENVNESNSILKLNGRYVDDDSVESSQNVYYVSTREPEMNDQKMSTNVRASNYNYKSALADFKTNLELIKKSQNDLKQQQQSGEMGQLTPEFSSFKMSEKREEKNEEDSAGIQSADELDKGSLESISEISNLGKFSKPIVVSDSSDTERFEYSTTLPCNEEDNGMESIASLSAADGQGILDDVTHTQTTMPEVENQDHITISSGVLNPIQAGVVLVNAGETGGSHLGEVETSLTAAVNENEFDYSLDGSQALKQNGVAKTSVENSDEQINPIVGSSSSSGDKLEKLTNVMPTSITDQGVEIQKSLEVYHSAPVHEIHYPAQITSQVTSIDQQVEAYLTTQKHENAKQVPFNDANTESQTQIDLVNSNSNNFQYISIEDQPLVLLQESQTILVGNDPSYVSDVEQKVNVNNLTPENFKRLVQNYVAHRDTQRTKVAPENLTANENFALRSSTNEQIASPDSGKLSHAFVMGQWNRVNDKSINQKVEVVTGEVQSQTQSNPPRITSEFSNIAQRLEPDRLNYREENQYHRQTNINEFEIGSKLNYPKSDINLTPQQAPIYTDELYAEGTKIIDNIIPNVVNAQSPFKSIPTDKNSVYMYTPKIPHGVRAKVNGYDASSNVNGNYLIKGRDTSTSQLLAYPRDKFVESALVKSSTPSYPMYAERLGEKHVPVLLQAYPVTVKKIIEKKVPYPIPKLAAQPYPIHILQQYPIEMVVEKPLHIPLDKRVRIPVPYPMEAPVKIPLSAGLVSTHEKSVHMPYGIRYGVAYQQIMHPMHTLYGRLDINSVDQGNNVNNNNNDNNSNNNNNNNTRNFEQNNIINKNSLYDSAVVPLATFRPNSNNRYGSLHQFPMSKQPISGHSTYPKKSYLSQLPFLTHSKSVEQPAYHWHVIHPSSNSGTTTNEKQKYKNVEYIGPVPLPQHALNPHQQNQAPYPAHQEPQRYPDSVSSSLRRVRMPEVHFYGKAGNFRQSKMEYGFKPPMIPSVQYDEETAMKVEN